MLSVIVSGRHCFYPILTGVLLGCKCGLFQLLLLYHSCPQNQKLSQELLSSALAEHLYVDVYK